MGLPLFERKVDHKPSLRRILMSSTMALDGLSTEILLNILECLTPLDILCAVRASSLLYRTFIAYKHHLIRHALRESIHPTCRADVLTALDAQKIPRLLKFGEPVTKVKLECFSLFSNDRTRRRQSHDELKVNADNLDTLFYLQADIERLIDAYCDWTLGNLSHHQEKPAQYHTTTGHPRSNLSPTEVGRLQRAFYRCEVYTRFQRVLSLLDKGGALNFSQIVLSFVSQFTLYEFEEFVCVQQFLAQFIRSLCESVEDDFFSHLLSSTTGTGAEQETEPENVSQLLDDSGLSFFTKSYRDQHHSSHMKYLISCGLPYILHLSFMEPPKFKRAILKSYMDSQGFAGTVFFSQGALDLESCDEKQREVFLRGRIVDIPEDRLDGPNLGWKWGTSFQDFVKSDSPALFDLRDRGYVFWDRERLQQSGMVDEPFVVCVGANYLPSGHHGPFVRLSVEERLDGLKFDAEAASKWKSL
ncbi:unnamed protein product [Penicillium salamii]|uniref:F-box domain-containing protein n=1 Tax=Penicillium salamii TaxID=1612424 RepID=A0A9W4IPU4_9EURO|nr:unnamed protein product [Penicillium salamii]